MHTIPNQSTTTKVPFQAYTPGGNPWPGLPLGDFTAEGSLDGAALSAFATTVVAEIGKGAYALTVNEQTTLDVGVAVAPLLLGMAHATAADVQFAMPDVQVVGPGRGRVDRPAGPAFRLTVSNRSDRRGKAIWPVRLPAGSINGQQVALDVSPIFGPLYITAVGTPTVTPLTLGSTTVTCAAVDWTWDGERREAYLQLGGTIALEERVLIQVPVTVDGPKSDVFEFVAEGLPATT